MHILKKIIVWRTFVDGSPQKHKAQRELKDLLSRNSSFTMLVRSIPAVADLPPDFFD